MNFNDFSTPSERDYKIMKQNYDKILISETQDLQDIHSKMLEQRANLLASNTDSRYDSIITKLDSNINELGNIISNNQSNILYKSPLIPLSRGIKSNPINVAQTDEAISPIRSREEIERHNRYNGVINNPSNNIPSDDVGRNPSPAMPITSPVNTNKRNSPMQSNPLSNLIKQFNLSWKKSKKQIISEDTHRNRFHNISIAHKKCEPHDIIIGSQIDIIRLLLLYLALRPNCKYLSRIAHITNEQFESLLTIQG